jgi:hypothetical protein
MEENVAFQRGLSILNDITGQFGQLLKLSACVSHIQLMTITRDLICPSREKQMDRCYVILRETCSYKTVGIHRIYCNRTSITAS